MSDGTLLIAASFLPPLPHQHTTPKKFKGYDPAPMASIDLIHSVFDNVYPPTKDDTSLTGVKVERSLESEHPSGTLLRLSPSFEVQEETNLECVMMIRLPESDNTLGLQDLLANLRPMTIPPSHVLFNTDHYTDEPISRRLGFDIKIIQYDRHTNSISRLSKTIRSRTSTGTINKRTSKAKLNSTILDELSFWSPYPTMRWSRNMNSVILMRGDGKSLSVEQVQVVCQFAKWAMQPYLLENGLVERVVTRSYFEEWVRNYEVWEMLYVPPSEWKELGSLYREEVAQ